MPQQITLDTPSLKLLKKPMGGYKYIAAYRKAEVIAGEDSFLVRVAGHFPHEALQLLDTFARKLFESPPQRRAYTPNRLSAYVIAGTTPTCSCFFARGSRRCLK